MSMPQSAVDSILAARRKTWLLRAWDRCKVYRLKDVGTDPDQRPQGRQNWPDDYVLHLSDIPFDLQPNRRAQQEYQAGGKTKQRGDWVVGLPYGTGLDEKMKVKGTTGDVLNRVFNLVGRTDGSRATHEEWEAIEIK
jgi:hypothetical protein